MAERFEKGTPFNIDFHRFNRFPFRQNPDFRPQKQGPKFPDFLCFGMAPAGEKGAPRLKCKTIPKEGGKGKKNAGKAGVFSL